MKMNNIIHSRWFVYSIRVFMVLLIILDVFLFKTVFIGIISGILEIFALTFLNVQEEAKEKEDKEEREKTNKNLDQIEKEVEEHSSEKRENEELIRIMINEGLVNEKNLAKKLRRRGFVSIYCYQKSLPKKVGEVIGKQPALDILNKLGFYRPGSNHNFYLIDEKNLPKKLRSIEKLEEFLNYELEKEWSKRLSVLKENDRKLYESYKDKKFWNFSYFIAKIPAGNSIVGHLNWSSFTPESRSNLFKNVKPARIKREINFHRISNMIKELDFDLLIRYMSQKDKKEVLKVKKELRDQLQIKDFRDYGKTPLSDYINFFKQYFGDEKAKRYANEVFNRASKFNHSLDKFGINIQENQAKK